MLDAMSHECHASAMTDVSRSEAIREGKERGRAGQCFSSLQDSLPITDGMEHASER